MLHWNLPISWPELRPRRSAFLRGPDERTDQCSARQNGITDSRDSSAYSARLDLCRPLWKIQVEHRVSGQSTKNSRTTSNFCSVDEFARWLRTVVGNVRTALRHCARDTGRDCACHCRDGASLRPLGDFAAHRRERKIFTRVARVHSRDSQPPRRAKISLSRPGCICVSQLRSTFFQRGRRQGRADVLGNVCEWM